MTSSTKTPPRLIPVTCDNRGNAVWHSIIGKHGTPFGVCNMVPDRIIPVIFVPGVMGSNLISSNDVKWLMDSTGSMKGWMARGAQTRKRTLRPEVTKVYDGGALPENTAQTAEELKRRGWGEVGALSYGDFLAWLENNLNDYDNAKGGYREALIGQALGAMTGEEALNRDEVALSYRYRFPVFACGYNWLGSNVDAAKRLSDKIDEIIKRYQDEKKKCEKVIIVTHSMGGLVARYCSEVLGRSKDILGISHGVMPAIGAAATYRRMKTGAERPPADGLLSWLATWLGAKVLGEDAAEMTAVLSTAPGPLQLLPMPEYGNHWLKIKDGGTEHSLPKQGDPYGEIYVVRGKWWSMCEDKLINPLNMETDPKKRQAQVDKDWNAFARMIKKDVKTFHTDIADEYHRNTYAFYGSAQEFRSYGNVGWTCKNGGRPSLLGGAGGPVDVLDAEPALGGQLKSERTVLAKPLGSENKTPQMKLFTLDAPDENGDGTVPHRSGMAPKNAAKNPPKSIMQVAAGHEPAYREGTDLERVRGFTVRAIVKIAQEVTSTSLRYE